VASFPSIPLDVPEKYRSGNLGDLEDLRGEMKT